MDTDFSDDYVVYLRFDGSAALEEMEVPVGCYASYEEARAAVRRGPWLNDVMIRYRGDAGGSE